MAAGSLSRGTEGLGSSGHLQLSGVEACFLALALHTLTVVDAQQRGARPCSAVDSNAFAELSGIDLWTTFVRSDPSFVVRYAAYHHFRSLGWVPKSGQKLGVDFVLYPLSPDNSHATYPPPPPPPPIYRTGTRCWFARWARRQPIATLGSRCKPPCGRPKEWQKSCWCAQL
jgi:hypothetical protein